MVAKETTNAAGKLKPPALQKGDCVAVVSLSAGTIGEASSAHQLARGLARLRGLGLVPVVMPHALDGREPLAAHPEWRAADLKTAMLDPTIKGIICAIGGEDTFRLAPYLMTDAVFRTAVATQPKLFSGFSDTTINHLMLYRLGLQTFYGPNTMNDLAELDVEMLPYTQQTIAHYFTNPATTPIVSAPVWYEERRDFSEAALDTPHVAHQEMRGYQVLHGRGKVSGPLLGGCLESLDDLLVDHLPGEAATATRYGLFPTPDEWAAKILFIETSEEQPTPASYRAMLTHLEKAGVFSQIVGIIAGKPQDEVHFDAYREILTAMASKYDLPTMFNLNFGHAYPRTALPYGAMATLDCDDASLTIDEAYFSLPNRV